MGLLAPACKAKSQKSFGKCSASLSSSVPGCSVCLYQVYLAYVALLFKSDVTYSSLEEDLGDLCSCFLLPACSDVGISTV